MLTKTLVTASALAFAVGAPASYANTSEIIDQIVAELSAQGFVHIEIDVERDGTFDVDAYGGGREGDFHFDAEGVMLSSDIDTNESYGVAYTGDEPGTIDVGDEQTRAASTDDIYDDDEDDDGDDDYDDDDADEDDDDDDDSDDRDEDDDDDD